ncbi:hypothetical protein CW304_23600 [Bacillus sp. UFRGS-B20]|nr:hypothetical protein CW304_23600 [Bacillus sp. UFRGS-B20]
MCYGSALTLGDAPPNKQVCRKGDTYESGIGPFHDANIWFHACRFLLMFVIFDVEETLFLYIPWVLRMTSLDLLN